MKVRQQREQREQPGYTPQHPGRDSAHTHTHRKRGGDLISGLTFLVRPDPPSGQAVSNRMGPGGGSAQPMATRHPGAPNGMCESPSLIGLQGVSMSPVLSGPPNSPPVPLRPRRGTSSSTDPGVQPQLKGPEGKRRPAPFLPQRNRTHVNPFIISVSRFRLTRAGPADLSAVRCVLIKTVSHQTKWMSRWIVLAGSYM